MDVCWSVIQDQTINTCNVYYNGLPKPKVMGMTWLPKTQEYTWKISLSKTDTAYYFMTDDKELFFCSIEEG